MSMTRKEERALRRKYRKRDWDEKTGIEKFAYVWLEFIFAVFCLAIGGFLLTMLVAVYWALPWKDDLWLTLAFVIAGTTFLSLKVS
jgi:hypothetical protein